MRGCLSVLVIAAVFLIGVVWFGGPTLAGTVVEATLTGSGFEADDLDVTVRSDPPLALALGRADRIEIDATDVRWQDLRAGSMTMRLDDVDLVGRTASTATGRFSDVEVEVADGDPALVQLTFDGPADRAPATIGIDGATVSRMALAAFEESFGTRPDSAALVAPDRILIRSGDIELGGTLSVEADGALVVSSGLGTVRLVEPDSSIPLRLTSVAIDGGDLVLNGTIDLESLLD